MPLCPTLASLFCAAALFNVGRGQDFTRDDPRLAEKLSFQANCLPFPQALAQMSAKTGVSLTADSSLKDDLVLLQVRERPIGEVMTRLAKHFSLAWERTGEAPEYKYNVGQSAEARRAEDTVRRKRDDDRVAEARQFIRRLTIALTTSPEARALKATQFKVTLERGFGMMSEDEDRTLRNSEGRFCDEVSQVRARFAAVLLDGLPEVVWQRLRSGETVSFSTSPLGGQIHLTGASASLARIMLDETAAVGYLPQVTGELMGFAPSGSVADGVKATICNAQVQIRDGRPYLAITLRTSDRRPIMGAEYPVGDPPSLTPFDVPSGKCDLPFLFPKSLDVMLYGDSGGRRLRPAARLQQDWLAGKIGFVEPISAAYGALLLALAEAADTDLIADAFDERCLEPWIPENGTVGEYLNRLCSKSESSWKIDEGWLSVRQAHAASYRARQLPVAVRTSIAQATTQRGDITLMSVAGMAAGLTLDQYRSFRSFCEAIGSPLAFGQSLPLGLLGALAGLSLTEWNSLSQGQAVPSRVAIRVREAIAREPIRPGFEVLEDLPAQGRLAIRVERLRVGDLIQFIDNPGRGGTLYSAIQFNELAALLRAGQRPDSSDYASFRFRQGHADRYQLSIRTAEATIYSKEWTLFSAPPSVAFRLDNLPSEWIAKPR